MMRDERYFPEPERFYPERHISRVMEVSQNDSSKSGLSSFSPDDPSSLVFGFGRRYVVNISLSVTAMSDQKWLE